MSSYGTDFVLVWYYLFYFSVLKGVLVAKKQLFRNEIPEASGGQTVFLVSRDNHKYLRVGVNN